MEIRRSASQRRRNALVSALAIIVGVLLMVIASQQVTRPVLPPEIEAALVPVVRPPIVNLGHKGAAPSPRGRIAEQEGVAIIESPVDSALSEYARLSGLSVVRLPNLPSVSVNFRGQARPHVLARELANTLLRQGVRLVETSDDRIAAVGPEIRLLHGNGAGNAAYYATLAAGAVSIFAGALFGWRSTRPTSSQTPICPHS